MARAKDTFTNLTRSMKCSCFIKAHIMYIQSVILVYRIYGEANVYVS